MEKIVYAGGSVEIDADILQKIQCVPDPELCLQKYPSTPKVRQRRIHESGKGMEDSWAPRKQYLLEQCC